MELVPETQEPEYSLTNSSIGNRMQIVNNRKRSTKTRHMDERRESRHRKVQDRSAKQPGGNTQAPNHTNIRVENLYSDQSNQKRRPSIFRQSVHN